MIENKIDVQYRSKNLDLESLIEKTQKQNEEMREELQKLDAVTTQLNDRVKQANIEKNKHQ